MLSFQVRITRSLAADYEVIWISYGIWDISQPKYLIHNTGRYTFQTFENLNH